MHLILYYLTFNLIYSCITDSPQSDSKWDGILCFHLFNLYLTFKNILTKRFNNDKIRHQSYNQCGIIVKLLTSPKQNFDEIKFLK